MTELPNFPIISQLVDGDVNDQFNCVPTSIAAGLEYLTGNKFTGGQVKDAVYGTPYQGVTEIGAFAEYCTQQGVHLSEVWGIGTVLTNAIIGNIKNGLPVLGTEPDPYEPKGTTGWTHAIIFYGFDENKGTLTAMDPYIAAPVTKSVTEWASILQSSEVWSMEGSEEVGGVPKGWTDDGTTLRPPSNKSSKVVVLGFRQWILEHSWNPDDVPLENEVHSDPLMISNPGTGAGQRQRFKYSTLGWTPALGVFLIPTNLEIEAIGKMYEFFKFN